MLERNQKFSLVLLCIFGLLGLELVLLSLSFDASIINIQGTVSGIWRIFGLFGDIAKIAVLAGVLFLLLLKDRTLLHWYHIVENLTIQRPVIWLIPQLASYALLFQVSAGIFDPELKSISGLNLLAWFGLACLSLVLTALMAGSLDTFKSIAYQEWKPILIATALATSVWLVSLYAEELWSPLSEWTFLLVSSLLQLIGQHELYVDVDTRVIAVKYFAVNIAPQCSGYEGIGLVVAFTAIYLHLYRKEFRFPQALLLIPFGICAIWLLNIARIAALIMIGAYWSPDIAVGGFHSQAGWITFIATSIGLLFLAKQLPYIYKKTNEKVRDEPQHHELENTELAIATLVPFVTLLFVIIVSSAFSAGFDWFYPARVIAVAAAVFWGWKSLQLNRYRPRLEALIVGVFVAITWVYLSPTDSEYNQSFQAYLDTSNSGVAIAWLAFRFVGSVITVPIAEELAFRSYLFCKLARIPVTTTGKLPISILAIAVSSLAFGALHGAWIAGTVAGLAYAIVRLRSNHIGDAIVAHSITNFCIFIYALIYGNWALI